MSPEFRWLMIAVVSVLSAARLTRLLVADKFPPALWLREQYTEVMATSEKRAPWQRLMYCPYCMAPWVMAIVVLTGVLSDWHTVWWTVNGIFGGSYLASVIVVFDGDYEDDEEDED